LVLIFLLGLLIFGGFYFFFGLCSEFLIITDADIDVDKIGGICLALLFHPDKIS
jgi:hypothetical protein